MRLRISSFRHDCQSQPVAESHRDHGESRRYPWRYPTRYPAFDSIEQHCDINLSNRISNKPPSQVSTSPKLLARVATCQWLCAVFALLLTYLLSVASGFRQLQRPGPPYVRVSGSTSVEDTCTKPQPNLLVLYTQPRRLTHQTVTKAYGS